MAEGQTLQRPKRRWYTVFSLSAAAFVDSSEGYTLNILWPNMYPRLGFDVSQLGPVLGLAGLVNTFTLPLWGWMADRFSRKALLFWITGVWGLWTMGIAFINTLPELYLVRLFSSLGLGVLWPTAFSLISDLFPSRERGRAAGVMTAVSFTGTLAAFFILPVLAGISPDGWRYGFVFMGIVSALTGILFIFINDPPRGVTEPEISDLVTKETAARFAFRFSDLPELAKIRTWWVLIFQQSFDGIAMAVLNGWAFTWLDGLGLGESGIIVVGLLMMGTLLGHLFFGWLGDVLENHSPNKGRATMALVGLIVSLPALACFIYFGKNGIVPLMVFGLFSGLGLASIDTGARWPIAQSVLRPELRATGRAAIDMVHGAVGSLAMTLTGLLVTHYSGNVASMMLWMVPLPKLIGLLLWLPVFYTYPKDRQNLHELLLKRREVISS